MDAEICRNALDRVPLSLIIDDSTALINLNYFFLRDRNRHLGQDQRWADVPVVTPESFTREWGEWCRDHGVRGKFSVVPNPANIGRLDHGLTLFGQGQLESWLQMCREVIVPSFDITPEMLTHTYVLDLGTLQPLPSRIWEQMEWREFGEADHVDEYIAFSCRILANIGLPPQGVTSPGGFGGKSLDLYARVTGEGCRSVTGNPTPFFFQRVQSKDVQVETPVWYPDRQAGTAVGEIIACTGDYTGSWTGYGEVDADYYITEDLAGGRLPAVIDAGSPCVLCSHWQGMYGMHDGDRRGFRTLQTVVERLRQRDPNGERTRWRTCSEITNYACVRELATVQVEGDTIHLDLPRSVLELTLRLRGTRARGIRLEQQPLQEAGNQAGFQSGTFYWDGTDTLLAIDPPAGSRTVQLIVQTGT
ncbi:MAG: hypothetical protein ACR2JY_03170 [Chloroflexota bacterium]